MPPPRPPDRLARFATLAVLACGLAATLALNLPGHLSYDSVVQLLDGRTGRYHTWHPPLMAWLLGIGDRVLPGTAVYVCAQAGLMSSVLALIVARAPRIRPWAPLATAALVALPHLVLWQAVVWKDVLFADLAVAGFVMLAQAAPAGRRPWRWLGLALALLLLGAAALVRQNGLVAPVMGAVALGVGVWRADRTRPARGAIVGLTALALTLLAMGLATAALNRRSIDGLGAVAQFRSLEIYDVAGMVARRPDLPLDRLPSAMARDLRAAALADYTPVRLDPIQGLPAFNSWTQGRPPAIDTQWRDLVGRHPVLWLRHRLAVFGWMLAPPDLTRCNPELVGVDGDASMLAKLGLREGWSPRDLAMARYSRLFHSTPVYAHWAYALAAAALIVAFLRRRGVEGLAYAAMLTAALAFTASFLLIGVACDYRYLYPLDLAVLTAAFRWAVGTITAPAAAAARIARRSAPPPPRRRSGPDAPPAPGSRVPGRWRGWGR